MSLNIFFPVCIKPFYNNQSAFIISVAISNLYSGKATNSKLEVEQTGTSLLRWSINDVSMDPSTDQPLETGMETACRKDINLKLT
jgi:hypothetical protein